MKCQIISVLALVSGCLATPFVMSEQLQDQLPLSHQNGDKRLIELGADERQWLREDEIDTLLQNNIHFMDVTDHQELESSGLAPISPVSIPEELSMTGTVKPMFKSIDKKKMLDFLTKFTSFQNRYYNSYGEQSAEFLFGLLQEIASQSAHEIKLEKFAHKWKQFSIIARFEPTVEDNNCKDEDYENCDIVLVSAHQDSINSFSRAEGRAPGADDDGSGSTSVLEAFRVLAMSQTPIRRPIEFHWYSGEEVGLLGSQDVASAYKKLGKKVVAMIQNDMTGYVDAVSRSNNSPHIGLIVDHVDQEVVKFLSMIIDEYVDIPYVTSRCGYACSDHASWSKAGYRSGFLTEGRFSEMNPNIHGVRDTVDKIDFDHAAEFTKLILAFAVELAQSQ